MHVKHMSELSEPLLLVIDVQSCDAASASPQPHTVAALWFGRMTGTPLGSSLPVNTQW